MSETTISPLSFIEFGHIASKSFLEDGVSMNSSILKIAEDNDLLPTQIQRVCEVANHNTYAMLFKTAQDKTFTFEVADPNKIVSVLDSPSREKVATDYFSAPTKVAIDVNKIFGILGTSNIPEVEEKIKVANQVIEKLQSAKDEINSRQVMLRHKIEAENENFYKLAKEMVLSGTPLEQLWTSTRKLGTNEDQIAQIYVKTAERMLEEGVLGAKLQYLLKKHGEAVDPALISSKLKDMSEPIGVQVINGSHPIVVSLNTLANYQADYESNNRAGKTLDEKFVYVRNRIGDLNSSKKVDQYIEKEQQK